MDRPAPDADDFRTPPALTRRDGLLLAAYCLLLFGLSLVGGRPLTMHEGVLPERLERKGAVDQRFRIVIL